MVETKPMAFMQTVQRIEWLCNAEAYTSGEMEGLAGRIGERAESLKTVRIPARSAEVGLARLHKLRKEFQGTGGPYAAMIAMHITGAIGTVMHRSGRVPQQPLPVR